MGGAQVLSARTAQSAATAMGDAVAACGPSLAASGSAVTTRNPTWRI